MPIPTGIAQLLPYKYHRQILILRRRSTAKWIRNELLAQQSTKPTQHLRMTAVQEMERVEMEAVERGSGIEQRVIVFMTRRWWTIRSTPVSQCQHHHHHHQHHQHQQHPQQPLKQGIRVNLSAPALTTSLSLTTSSTTTKLRTLTVSWIFTLSESRNIIYD